MPGVCDVNAGLSVIRVSKMRRKWSTDSVNAERKSSKSKVARANSVVAKRAADVMANVLKDEEDSDVEDSDSADSSDSAYERAHGGASRQSDSDSDESDDDDDDSGQEESFNQRGSAAHDDTSDGDDDEQDEQEELDEAQIQHADIGSGQKGSGRQSGGFSSMQEAGSEVSGRSRRKDRKRKRPDDGRPRKPKRPKNLGFARKRKQRPPGSAPKPQAIKKKSLRVVLERCITMLKGSFDAFLEDFRLVYRNCMTYNAPDTVYYKTADKLAQYGEKFLAREALTVSDELDDDMTSPAQRSRGDDNSENFDAPQKVEDMVATKVLPLKPLNHPLFETAQLSKSIETLKNIMETNVETAAFGNVDVGAVITFSAERRLAGDRAELEEWRNNKIRVDPLLAPALVGHVDNALTQVLNSSSSAELEAANLDDFSLLDRMATERNQGHLNEDLASAAVPEEEKRLRERVRRRLLALVQLVPPLELANLEAPASVPPPSVRPATARKDVKPNIGAATGRSPLTVKPTVPTSSPALKNLTAPLTPTPQQRPSVRSGREANPFTHVKSREDLPAAALRLAQQLRSKHIYATHGKPDGNWRLGWA
ncbi:hypothetical protein HDU96_007529 [Phlyctochytrium bullatum]|nr:hypothetical protein HDU96_007529 [Phlyctochytrium bullatum]